MVFFGHNRHSITVLKAGEFVVFDGIIHCLFFILRLLKTTGCCSLECRIVVLLRIVCDATMIGNV